MTRSTLFKALAAAAFFSLAACNSTTPTKPMAHANAESSQQASIKQLVQKLNLESKGYNYQGVHHYGGELGYSLRYTKPSRQIFDFYIWPVSAQVPSETTNEELVRMFGDGAAGDVIRAGEAGAYDQVDMLSAHGVDAADTFIATYSFTLLRDKVRSLSYVHQAAFGGNLLKARVTVPDNEANRASETEREQLVADVFATMIAEMKAGKDL